MLGIYGFLIGMLAIVIHLAGLESFGLSYLQSGMSKNVEEKDSDYVIKGPIQTMVNRPAWVKQDSKVRLKRNES